MKNPFTAKPELDPAEVARVRQNIDTLLGYHPATASYRRAVEVPRELFAAIVRGTDLIKPAELAKLRAAQNNFERVMKEVNETWTAAAAKQAWMKQEESLARSLADGPIQLADGAPRTFDDFRRLFAQRQVMGKQAATKVANEWLPQAIQILKRLAEAVGSRVDVEISREIKAFAACGVPHVPSLLVQTLCAAQIELRLKIAQYEAAPFSGPYVSPKTLIADIVDIP